MKISGFTFIRNGVQFDFPFRESILSLLPVVDELVVVVGQGTDQTLQEVRALAERNNKIKIHESVWDEGLRKDGLILSQQTNLAMEKCSGDWGIYLQGDEVLHSDDYEKIRSAIAKAERLPEAEGILFDYLHFYGDFFIVNKNPSAYRHEVRAIRLKRNVVSWKDAQGFRVAGSDGSFRKLNVIASGARIFHYGWVRPQEVMAEKTKAFDRLYHADGGGTGDNYLYKRIYGLERFVDSHPEPMKKRIEEKRWKVDLLSAPLVFTWKDIRKVLARWMEKCTGWLPFEYRNYKRIE